MADVVSTQIISDTFVRTVVNLTNVSDATGETNVLKVNAASLQGATKTLTLTSGANNFKIGETIYVANSSSNSTAIVADVDNTRNVWTVINVSDANSMFVNNATITGATSNVTRTQSGALANGQWRLTMTRLVYDVTQGKSVKLIWAGNTNSTAVILTNSAMHEYSPNGLTVPPDPTQFPNGNLLLTTIGFANLSTYSILLELKKTSGYLNPLTEKNPDLGYVDDSY